MEMMSPYRLYLSAGRQLVLRSHSDQIVYLQIGTSELKAGLLSFPEWGGCVLAPCPLSNFV